MSKVTAVPLRPVSRAGVTTLWIGIALLVVIGVGAAWKTSQPAAMTAMPAARFMIANGNRSGVKTTPSGLEYQVITPGSGGATPAPTDGVQIEYSGALTDGTVFDSTPPRQPIIQAVASFVPGFAEALTLMPQGSHYRFWIPPELGYGVHPNGPIPANSVLVFDITMHRFGPLAPQQMPQGVPQQ